jgi:endoglucanase
MSRAIHAFRLLTSTVSLWVIVVCAIPLIVQQASHSWTGNVAAFPIQSPVKTRLLYDDNPLSGNGFYVDPASSAAVAAGQTPSAELQQVAQTPQAWWLTDTTPTDQAAGAVSSYIGAAAASGAMPVIVLYAIPHRDCGSFTAGGFASGDDYRAWIGQVAAGVGMARVGVILEPDALTAADCLPQDQQRERTALLRDAVGVLTQNPNAAVYVDGGHSRWLTPDQLAARLRAVGVERARGFALNTSNFFTTDEEIGYGEVVSQLLKGAHYVIDTSRNGAGPAPDKPLNWCNPAGRAIGANPTTATAGAHADAYLWVKHPGESDGQCDRGDPPSGVFMPEYATDLVRNARN